MANIIQGISHPELVIGIAGPIGIDIDAINQAIADSLISVDYDDIQIRITDEIKEITSSVKVPKRTDYNSIIRYKMAHATAICRKHNDQAFLMRIAIDAIQRERLKLVETTPKAAKSKVRPKMKPTISVVRVPQRVAYVVRQIKRPQEVQLLREVYGKQFVLVSAYGAEPHRKAILEEKLRRSMSLGTKSARISALADELIQTDADESDDNFGQHMRDAFHLADVSVDGIEKGPMAEKMTRFFNAFFGLNDIAPTKEEYGMYAAKSASLRSSDLSRQVGAAVFTSAGEMLTQGCNEVPRAMGGTYWDNETPDYRDIKLGTDPNDTMKSEVIRDLLERLVEAKLMTSSVQGSAADLVKRLTQAKGPNNKGSGAGCLRGAMVTDLTEYGRVVHAEMSAICDAARNGVQLKGAILFCTTFPCHNCTKHIIASGIKSVIFMEPYPKSKAKELHEHEIEIERPSIDKVSFIPFLGIAPYRYRDIFQKGSRKSAGVAKKWYFGEPRPMVDVIAPTYIQLEDVALIGLLGEVTGS